jgi:hypothetical protein
VAKITVTVTDEQSVVLNIIEIVVPQHRSPEEVGNMIEDHILKMPAAQIYAEEDPT